MENKIINGDCIEQMKLLEENSVDAIVTDPPYGLAFMGKKWDNMDSKQFQDFTNQWARACWDVLKPGGFLLAFGGTRTYHRLVCGIEDAGFEIRDTIMWLYGSGFPKSLNIGKQIDKIEGNEREVIGRKIKRVDGTLRNTEPNGAYMKENIKTKQTDGYVDIEKPGSIDSEKWEGWGTALKPACEPIVVARKPLSEKNVALNVLKWGTGGINVDECRIGTTRENETRKRWEEPFAQKVKVKEIKRKNKGEIGMIMERINKYDDLVLQGRFPANIILDEEAGKMLDEQTGELNKGHFPANQNKHDASSFSVAKGKIANERWMDKGGASRFFYCAKASKSERNFGCEDFETKAKCEIDKMGGEKCSMKTGSGNERNVAYKNNHPTVKPIALMEYLIKLVSKEGAVVLDPFLGSGTTLLACYKLNRNGIGIEKEEEYIKICKARIKPFLEQTKIT